MKPGATSRRPAHGAPGLALRATAEAFGTALLVLVGCGAIVLDSAGALPLGVLGVAAAFGCVIALVVGVLGRVSGAHINPAVTLALWRRALVDARSASAYVSAQLAGAGLGAFVLHLLAPGAALGTTQMAPGVPWVAGVVAEAVATGLLVAVILVVATGRRLPGWVAPVAIGGTVAVAAAWLGPVTGASLNPARSFGPALISGSLPGLVPYLLGPVGGGLAGAWLACRVLPVQRCCCGAPRADATVVAS